MSKKLLTEEQVRKFMGLANMDANVSSNFIQEKYHAKKDDEEMEEGMHADAKKDDEMAEGMHDAKKDDEMAEGMHDAKVDDEMDEGMHDKKEEDMHEAAHEDMDADAEGGDDEDDADDVDVMLDQDEVKKAREDAKSLLKLLDKLMGGAAPEMDDAPADEPEMEMGDDKDLGLDEISTELTEDEMIQEVAKRVAKRINEAAKKAKK